LSSRIPDLRVIFDSGLSPGAGGVTGVFGFGGPDKAFISYPVLFNPI
jgi:hypothetical protein